MCSANVTYRVCGLILWTVFALGSQGAVALQHDHPREIANAISGHGQKIEVSADLRLNTDEMKRILVRDKCEEAGERELLRLARTGNLEEACVFAPTECIWIEAYPDNMSLAVLCKTEESFDFLDTIIDAVDQPSTVGLPVVIELKTSFTLPLVFQGLRRQSVTDLVYVAVARPNGSTRNSLWGRHYRDIVKLCRMLGLGLMTVQTGRAKGPNVQVHLDPAPYQPRKNKRRCGLLLREFQRRVGDPNQGGMSKRPIVTAYRQDALKCAWFLQQHGPTKAASVKTETGVRVAPRILQRDVYGWFQRAEHGIYELTPVGERALDVYSDVVDTLTQPNLRRLST